MRSGINVCSYNGDGLVLAVNIHLNSFYAAKASNCFLEDISVIFLFATFRFFSMGSECSWSQAFDSQGARFACFQLESLSGLPVAICLNGAPHSSSCSRNT